MRVCVYPQQIALPSPPVRPIFHSELRARDIPRGGIDTRAHPCPNRKSRPAIKERDRIRKLRGGPFFCALLCRMQLFFSRQVVVTIQLFFGSDAWEMKGCRLRGLLFFVREAFLHSTNKTCLVRYCVQTREGPKVQHFPQKTRKLYLYIFFPFSSVCRRFWGKERHLIFCPPPPSLVSYFSASADDTLLPRQEEKKPSPAVLFLSLEMRRGGNNTLSQKRSQNTFLFFSPSEKLKKHFSPPSSSSSGLAIKTEERGKRRGRLREKRERLSFQSPFPLSSSERRLREREREYEGKERSFFISFSIFSVVLWRDVFLTTFGGEMDDRCVGCGRPYLWIWYCEGGRVFSSKPGTDFHFHSTMWKCRFPINQAQVGSL